MILRDDHDADWTAAADSTLERRVYYAQNWRADVVALMADNGRVLERTWYEAYGTPHGSPAADLTGSADSNSDFFGVPDGVLDSVDYSYYLTLYNNSDARADLSGSSNPASAAYGRPDGTVDSVDYFFYLAIYAEGATAGRGVLSQTDLRNRKGYAGYEWDPGVQAATMVFHVRNRVFLADTGRWCQRDPYRVSQDSRGIISAGSFGETVSTSRVIATSIGVFISPIDGVPRYCAPGDIIVISESVLGEYMPILVDTTNLTRYVFGSPMVNRDPTGLGCRIKFSCNFSSSSGSLLCKNCNYSCVESGDPSLRPNLTVNCRGGDDFTCDDIPPLPVRITETRRVCGWPAICSTSYSTTVAVCPNNPDRDCSRTVCRGDCDRAMKIAKKACKKLPPGPLRIACWAARELARETCYEMCNFWCLNE